MNALQALNSVCMGGIWPEQPLFGTLVAVGLDPVVLQAPVVVHEITVHRGAGHRQRSAEKGRDRQRWAAYPEAIFSSLGMMIHSAM
jgi:hypothetical protein